MGHYKPESERLYSPKAEKKMNKVYKEFGKGELHSGSKKGPVVTNQKQASAIAISEARHKGYKAGKPYDKNDKEMKKPEKGSGELSKIREKPGESGAFKKRPGPFAGPDKTFPMNNLAHARNALARAHFAKNPEGIKEKVYAKYPALKERHKERTGVDAKKYDAYKSR